LSPARCRVAGCRRKAHARGLCQKHYDEERKSRGSRRAAAPGKRRESGRLKSAAPAAVEDDGDGRSVKMCSVPGCAGPHHARGYCKMHYGQLRRSGRLEDAPGAEAAGGRTLSLDQRLVEIKKRHELLKREIASIHRTLESESNVDSEG
jgi:hypothetical protein